MFPKVGSYYGRTFRTQRGVTQRDPVYPIVFNILVDTIVRAVILEICDP